MRSSFLAAFGSSAASLALLLNGCHHTPVQGSQPMTHEKPAVDIYALSVKTLEAEPAPLSQYRGQVTLLVNVASACGYTPQYAGLERVYTKYKAKGFAVL